jgi:CheY-like chemotaxis protein
MAHLPSDGPQDPPRAHEAPADSPARTAKNDDAGRALRILVVDDYVDAADSLAVYLRLHGHTVRTAHDGTTGIAVAREFCPHVILLDIGLPRLDGYRVAEQIRQHPTLQKVCLIAVTGFAREADERAARAAGFDHFLIKPVDPAQLLATLDRCGSHQSPGAHPSV